MLTSIEKRRAYYRAYYQKNKAKLAVKYKEYYEANKKKINDHRRLWEQANKEVRGPKHRAWAREYYAKHKEHIKQQYKEWAKANRSKVNAYHRKYYAKHKAAANAITKRWQEKFKGTHPMKQWEITLSNGMKQYTMGRTDKDAVNKLRSFVSTDRTTVVSVKEYCLMPEPRRFTKPIDKLS